MVNAPVFLWAHLGAALVALALGAAQLLRRKGGALHRLLGRVFVGAMLLAAATSYWLRGGGAFSWIHALSVWTVISVIVGVVALRRGRLRAHRGWMIGAYVGLVVAAVFALAPNRFLGGALFGG